MYSETYPAPAKLNLFLHVVGRRPDGYHLLQTVFRFIDHFDTLNIEVLDTGEVILEDAISGIAPEKNLCMRAAHKLQQLTGCTLGARIRLNKRLPVGGGLGGGSSDAATTLMVLNRLWNTGLDRKGLMSLALELGADVPVFIFGESAFAEGIGERLHAIHLPPSWYVVLIPPVSVPTSEIFGSPELTRDSIPIKISDFSIEGARNDLEPVVCRKYREVWAHLEWLKSRGRALMTGSGACVFAAYATESEARQVLGEAGPGMVGFVAQGLDRHPLWHLVP